MRAFILAAVLAAFSFAAWAHGSADWIRDGGFKRADGYTPCCNEHDCKPMPDGAVRVTAEGYLIVETGQVIPYDWKALHRSVDERFWSCRTTQVWCFFAPQAGA